MSDTPEDLPAPPPFPGLNRLLLGAPLQPLDRLGHFSPPQFEIFAWEWLADYRAKQYCQVQRIGGSGDKGRDVIAWIDPPGTNPRRWDNYQCKHYAAKLTPSEFCVELGKLCYYTYTQSYTIPEHYYIVTHKGIGNDLETLLSNTDLLRGELLTHWDTRCLTKITKKHHVPLDSPFLDYISRFPFNIVEAIPPEDILREHAKTKYHAAVFGIISTDRPKLVVPVFTEDEAKSTRYVRQIYAAFASHMGCDISTCTDFASRADLNEVFEDARVCFYTAETLREFSRESFPDEQYFAELLDQFHQGVKVTVLAPYPDGYHRLIRTCEVACSLNIAHVLNFLIAPNDAKGMCHQLANVGRVQWATA